MGSPSAAEQRLRLRTERRRARQQAEFTQRQVAERMEWSSSKLLRIESGEVGISAWNGFAMARFCAQDGATLRADMMTVLRRASAMPLPRLWLN